MFKIPWVITIHSILEFQGITRHYNLITYDKLFSCNKFAKMDTWNFWNCVRLGLRKIIFNLASRNILLPATQ